MAEEFFKFQDNEDVLSQSFKDFEEEWLRLGQEFSVVFDAGNSPQDLHQIEENEPAANLNQIQGVIKRKLSEAEDSLIYNRKRMRKENQMWGFTQEKVDEDPLLKTFRQGNPEKYQALEKRTCTQGPPRTTKYSPVSPEYNPASPEYSPEKRTCTQGPPRTTKYSPVSPEYSPASPEYSPVVLKSPTHVPLESFLTSPGNTLTPLQAPLTSSGYPIGCFTQQTSPDQYPLKEEVTALCELVDSVRVDLLQTSMIVNFLQDYLKKMK